MTASTSDRTRSTGETRSAGDGDALGWGQVMEDWAPEPVITHTGSNTMRARLGTRARPGTGHGRLGTRAGNNPYRIKYNDSRYRDVLAGTQGWSSGGRDRRVDGFFGEMALIDSGARSATAVAKNRLFPCPDQREAVSLHGGRDSLFCNHRDANTEYAVAASDRSHPVDRITPA